MDAELQQKIEGGFVSRHDYSGSPIHPQHFVFSEFAPVANRPLYLSLYFNTAWCISGFKTTVFD